MQPASGDEVLTARNKALVRDFYTTVLIGRDVDAAPRFMRADYIQHNPHGFGRRRKSLARLQVPFEHNRTHCQLLPIKTVI